VPKIVGSSERDVSHVSKVAQRSKLRGQEGTKLADNRWQKTTVVLVWLFFTLGAVRAWPAPGASITGTNVRFTVDAFVQKGFGGTAYDLSEDDGGGITSLSQLEFPQVQAEAGVSLGMSINRDRERQWLIEASYSHSVFDIQGTMNDYDWTQYPVYPPIPWSYTHSQDSTLSWQAAMGIARRLFTVGSLSLSLYGSFRYQYASHVENTATGWQYVWDTSTSAYDLYGISDPTSDVLEYALMSYAPGLGVLFDLQVLPGLSFELRGCYTPVYASDRDDHKLRTKLSTASGWGNGADVDVRVVYQFGGPLAKVAPYVAADGEFVYYSISTTQTQYWYGNADASNGAPEGTTISGVGHVITSAQYQVGVRFGVAF